MFGIDDALMLAGAIVGGLAGGETNAQRKETSDKELARLKFLENQNWKQRKAYAEILKGNVTVGALQNSAANEADATSAFQNTSDLESKAGRSGFAGGTPFYQAGLYAAQAARQVKLLSMARSISLANTQKTGEMQLDEYSNKAYELGQSFETAQKENSYLDSPLAWAMSIGTGAMSGATMASQVSTSLEGMGVNMDAAFPDVFKTMGENSAKGEGLVDGLPEGVTALFGGGSSKAADPLNLLASGKWTDNLSPAEKNALAITSQLPASPGDTPTLNKTGPSVFEIAGPLGLKVASDIFKSDLMNTEDLGGQTSSFPDLVKPTMWSETDPLVTQWLYPNMGKPTQPVKYPSMFNMQDMTALQW